MGYIGKTTLAQEVSCIVSNKYDAYHFLGNIRSWPFEDVECQLLDKLDHWQKVLVVVDDIDSTSSKSISSLLHNHILGNGSDFILTSHDWDVIKKYCW